ncbi:MAG: transposase [Phycisphaerae bacterium]|nr:transposase [Phycisphaerae bacterium]
MIVTRKIQIACLDKEHYKTLEEMLRTCRLIANKAQTLFYVYWQEIMDQNVKSKDVTAYFKEKYGYSYQQTIYHNLRKQFPDFPSRLTDDVISQGNKTFKADLKNGLLKGERSLRTYRNGIIPVRSQTSKIEQTEDDYVFSWIKHIKFALVFGRDRSDNKSIVERIIKGEYKMSDSKIIRDWRNNKKPKWFLLLCVDIPERENALDENIAIGVDLGIAAPAVCALNQGKARAFIGDMILLKRFAMQKQHRTRQRNFIPANGKHGRQKVDKAIYKMGDKERRFVHSFNHKITREIIKFALKHRASKIYTEDLSGYDSNQTILRNWSFYELQSMLEYKAKQQKIKLIKIPAKYTSRACSACGHIDKENRKTQSKFKCTSCDFEANADYNAALNIARGGVKIPKDLLTSEESDE